MKIQLRIDEMTVGWEFTDEDMAVETLYHLVCILRKRGAKAGLEAVADALHREYGDEPGWKFDGFTQTKGAAP